ncbi:MAG: aldehyde dehydrogenase family protein, partial [Chrysiogenetes bacterium]|nr:aldehyde dehydrogenase family protein [Chrysiogenetes bacterium]
MADTAKISNQVGALRKTFSTGKTRSIAWRQEQLRALKRFIREREKELYAALKEDLHKSEFEAFTAELAMVIGEADLCIKNLPKWSRAKKIPTIMAAQPGKSYMVPEPQGVVLIIGAWNYPVQLTLVPLVGAIAGGNCAVIKPSEVAPATSKVIAQQLPNYLDKDAYCVVEGAVDETTALLEEKFDHYFYTGNGRVGSIVMAAAAKHLGQVTLELGGKSPCIVDHTADLDVAAKRIAWGKFYNAGQTCVAPDYVMVEKDVEEPLLANLRDALKEFYGEDPKQSDDYCRIVNERHHQRLAPLLKSGEAYVGGEVDEADRYIAPTVLRNVSKDSAVMEDEIFGPILPVVAVNSIDEATDYLRAAGGRQGRPLLLTLIDE